MWIPIIEGGRGGWGLRGNMDFFEPPAKTEYAMWNQGWDWLVIAHERVGVPELAVVSVQFHPPSVRLPKEKPGEPMVEPVKQLIRELEPA